MVRNPILIRDGAGPRPHLDQGRHWSGTPSWSGTALIRNPMLTRDGAGPEPHLDQGRRWSGTPSWPGSALVRDPILTYDTVGILFHVTTSISYSLRGLCLKSIHFRPNRQNFLIPPMRAHVMINTMGPDPQYFQADWSAVDEFMLQNILRAAVHGCGKLLLCWWQISTYRQHWCRRGCSNDDLSTPAYSTKGRSVTHHIIAANVIR